MLNNLKAKVNGNKLNMEFSINRADFVINITYMSNCVYRYGVTGSRSIRVTKPFATGNRCKYFKSIKDVLDYIIKHVSFSEKEYSDFLAITILSLEKISMIEDDKSFTELQTSVHRTYAIGKLQEISELITCTFNNNSQDVPNNWGMQSGTPVAPRGCVITPDQPTIGTSVRPLGVQVDLRKYNPGLTIGAPQATPIHVAPVLTKEQKLNIILADIETIEILLKKVKDAARRLQAEIKEEENK